MKSRVTLQGIGMVFGIGIFLMTGLCVTNASKTPESKVRAESPLNDPVTAPAQALGAAFAAVAAHVSPSVVSVSSEKVLKLHSQEMPFPFGGDFFRQFFGDHGDHFDLPEQQQGREYRIPQRGMGSGVVIDGAGHVLTNYHVVRDVDEIQIILPDKRQFPAKIVGSDPRSDIAVIEIKGNVPVNLTMAKLGDSDGLAVGEMLLAIGAPFGLQQTVTAGILSAKGRSNVGIADFEDFLQTDAAINPGNSGGPLVNMRGEVIGLNTAIATSIGQYSGVGFAIPSNMIKIEVPVLSKGGTIKRGMLGVAIQDLTPDLASKFHVPSPGPGMEPQGTLVAQVNADSPAEKAGMKPGDVIVGYRGKPVQNMGQFRNGVAETAPGTKVDIEILRDGKKQTLNATVGELPAGPLAKAQTAEGGGLSSFGFKVQPLTPALAKQLGYEHQRGVVVVQVQEGGPAALAGLRPKDLIVEVDRQKVNSVADLDNAMTKAKDPNGLLLLVKREGASLFILMRKE